MAERALIASLVISVFLLWSIGFLWSMSSAARRSWRSRSGSIC